MFALALTLVVPLHWPELAILAAAPLGRVTLWNVGVRQCVAHTYLVMRRALIKCAGQHQDYGSPGACQPPWGPVRKSGVMVMVHYLALSENPAARMASAISASLCIECRRFLITSSNTSRSARMERKPVGLKTLIGSFPFGTIHAAFR